MTVRIKKLSKYNLRNYQKKSRGPRDKIINKKFLRTFIESKFDDYDPSKIELSEDMEDYFNVIFEKIIIKKFTLIKNSLQDGDEDRKIRIGFSRK